MTLRCEACWKPAHIRLPDGSVWCTPCHEAHQRREAEVPV